MKQVGRRQIDGQQTVRRQESDRYQKEQADTQTESWQITDSSEIDSKQTYNIKQRDSTLIAEIV